MSIDLRVGTRIDHDKYGEGVVSKVTLTDFEVFFARGGKVEFSKASSNYEILESPEDAAASGNEEGVDITQLERIVSYVLDKYNALQEIVPMGDKWTGGKLVMQPGNTSLQSKEIPIEAFFHKIVMLRDRLRVLCWNKTSIQTKNLPMRIRSTCSNILPAFTAVLQHLMFCFRIRNITLWAQPVNNSNSKENGTPQHNKRQACPFLIPLVCRKRYIRP
jgi:hypothetical protein